jgi:hypothetical protein
LALLIVFGKMSLKRKTLPKRKGASRKACAKLDPYFQNNKSRE